MSQNYGKEGQVGISIRELSSVEYDKYCTNNLNVYSQNKPPENIEGNKFSENFYLRVVTSGCYYLNDSFYWSSYGVEILEESNSTHTVCLASHLTDFAGGWVVLPPKIDFDYVWQNASFTQNPTIYATVIALISFYILAAMLCIYFDRKDALKIGYTILPVKNQENKYYYEIIVFTRC